MSCGKRKTIREAGKTVVLNVKYSIIMIRQLLMNLLVMITYEHYFEQQYRVRSFETK